VMADGLPQSIVFDGSLSNGQVEIVILHRAI
jgi:hypothetical protein